MISPSIEIGDQGGSMTVQAKDEFYFDGGQFALFDVSDGKVLSCAKCVGGLSEDVCCTACYRGSVASYEVADGILLLREATGFNGLKATPALSMFFSKRGAVIKEARVRPGAIIPFTGHLIITRGGWSMDFFSSIFEADKAYELEFDEGLFVGATDLEDFIKAGRTYLETAGQVERRELPIDAGEVIAEVGKLSRVSPKGRYTHSTYVWRFDEAECVLCKSIDS